jgi:penicillin-binding protein 1C
VNGTSARRARPLPAGTPGRSSFPLPEFGEGPGRGSDKRRKAFLVLGLALCGAFALSAIAVAAAVLCVPYPAARLSPDAGAPLVLTDRDGETLRRVEGPASGPGRDAWVSLTDVRSHALLSLLASEDRRFFEHAGVDPVGLARATWLDLKGLDFAYGGSTITMQLVRMVHSPGAPRTLANKAQEMLLALRLERALGKREILEQYVNRAYFGRGAYGIEAAARTYFDKSAASLSSGEATLLAALPRAPSFYDPIRHLDRALSRRDHVLGLLVDRGLVTPDESARIRRERVRPQLTPAPSRAPHFCDYVLASLSPEVRARGGTVRTTLDLRLQALLEHKVAAHVRSLAGAGVGQAGMVVLDTRTGEILAMVGSPDYAAEAGQINIAARRRHPGSALKPFVYALALDAGATPASIAADLREVASRYEVDKATQKERGPVRYREALAGSYNLAAVHVLESVGEDKLITILRRAGVGSVPGEAGDYGLRLALGATKVRLLDLAAGYGFLARGGRVTRPSAILGGPRADVQVFSPATSWLVMDVLSDPDARRPMFGADLPVDGLPFEVAFKTGTSRGFSDTVAVGVTEQVTVAAWAGNFSGRPTHGVIAMDAAAPLVRAGLLAAARGRRLTLPPPPAGVVEAEICSVSGELAGPNCPHRKLERFAAGRAPTSTCSWHVREGDGVAVRYPTAVAAFMEREAHAGGRGLGVR